MKAKYLVRDALEIVGCLAPVILFFSFLFVTAWIAATLTMMINKGHCKAMSEGTGIPFEYYGSRWSGGCYTKLR